MALLGTNVAEGRIYTWLKASADLETLIGISSNKRIKVVYSEPHVDTIGKGPLLVILLNMTEEDESFAAAKGIMDVRVYIPHTNDTNSADYIDQPALLALELRDVIRERLGPTNVTSLSDTITDASPSTDVRFAQSVPIDSTIDYLENSKHFMVSVRFRVVISVEEDYSVAAAGNATWE
tara:strand:- start:5809 stop:6345 length:537 start_codon:yes stop_codon:yes gene_type:complete